MFKLIQNRYYFYNYKQIFNSKLFCVVVFIPNKLDLNIIKQNNKNFLIKKNLLNNFFKLNSSLFTGFNYFFVFNDITKLLNYHTFLIKNINLVKIFFYKINNYFITSKYFNVINKIIINFKDIFTFNLIFLFKILIFLIRFFMHFSTFLISKIYFNFLFKKFN